MPLQCKLSLAPPLLHKYSTLSYWPITSNPRISQRNKEKKKMAVANNVLCIFFIISLTCMVQARIPGVYSAGAWQSAHATFYGGSDASGTMGLN